MYELPMPSNSLEPLLIGFSSPPKPGFRGNLDSPMPSYDGFARFFDLRLVRRMRQYQYLHNCPARICYWSL